MSIWVEFVLPALLVSVSALVALRLAQAAPPSLRFGIALIGMLAWVVPWPLINTPAPSPGAVPTTEWIGQGMTQLSSMKHEVGAKLEGVAPMADLPAKWWVVVFLPGLVWFLFDYSAHLRAVRRLRHTSLAGAELASLLPESMAAEAPEIRIVPKSAVALAAGLWNATIWVGADIGDDDTLRVALTHEAIHVRRRDPLRLLFLALLARLYWFNPIVRVLRRQAALAIESGCDAACARSLGCELYRETLARLVLEGQRRRGLMLAPTLRSASFDLARLALLRDGTGMNGRAWIAACAALLGSASGVALAAVTAPDLRSGEWIEITSSARYGYDVMPSTRRFERLANGMTRIRHVESSSGRAITQVADLRCDDEEYRQRNSAGSDYVGIVCESVDRWTNIYTATWLDGSGRIEHSTETVSRDGATIELTVLRELGGVTLQTTRTFGRLR